MKFRDHLHIGHLPPRDDGERGKIAIMIQKQMQFDGPLDPAKLGPMKGADTEVNDAGIEVDQVLTKRIPYDSRKGSI